MAAKRYNIYFWHGRTESLAAELMAIEGVSQTDDALEYIGTVAGDSTLQYIGTLDNFAEQYGRQFIVRAPDNLICVTQYNSWSAR